MTSARRQKKPLPGPAPGWRAAAMSVMICCVIANVCRRLSAGLPPYRRGSTPEDSRTNPAASTSSWTTLRSKALMGSVRRPTHRCDTSRSRCALGNQGRAASSARNPQHRASIANAHRSPTDSQPSQLLQRLEHAQPFRPTGTPPAPGLPRNRQRRRRHDPRPHPVDVTVEVGDVQERLESPATSPSRSGRDRRAPRPRPALARSRPHHPHRPPPHSRRRVTLIARRLAHIVGVFP